MCVPEFGVSNDGYYPHILGYLALWMKPGSAQSLKGLCLFY